MKVQKRKLLEAAGFKVGTTAEFLGLSEEECRLVELRLAVSRALRQRRQKLRLTQQQLADRLGSSQSRVAQMESAAADVSLDLLFRGLFAVGGNWQEISHRHTNGGEWRDRRGKGGFRKTSTALRLNQCYIFCPE